MIAPDAWSPADGLTLEPNALRASKETSGCQVLSAGPGAGKTEMLAQRADFLLRTGTCRYPKRILAISFKVDASKNLKDRVRARCGNELAARFDSYTFHAFAKRIIDRFRPILTGDDALDVDYTIGKRKVTRRQIEFEDLVPLAIKILEKSPLARRAISQTYSDVFLDEFQDCTSSQYELIKLAFSGTSIRITAVGDTKQRIMAWAGALDGILKLFAHDFSAKARNLYRNFRSEPRLLRMQNEIIRTMDPAAVMPDDQLEGDEGLIYDWRFDDSEAEARGLADTIATWIADDGLAPSQIAVLVSRQPHLYADHLMKALERQQIPYRNEQEVQDLCVEPLARLVVDYLSCVFGRRDPRAWTRLTNQLNPFGTDEAQLSVLSDLHHFVAGERKKAAENAVSGDPYLGWWSMAVDFLKKIGMKTIRALSPDYESRARLKEVLDTTRGHIESFLNLEPDLPKALERLSDDQAVRILTVHKSKGLEFDTVIVLGVEEETFWSDDDEERCAFFVAVSRAKRRLVLTVSDKRETPPTNPPRWRERRTPHNEFLGYAAPLLSL